MAQHQNFRQLLLANEVNVREMEFSDLGQVKALSQDIYGGTDYTNSVLKQWLEHDRWYPFCVETSTAQIIGFTALNITDNKTNVVVRSSRIAHDFRGKGIYKFMVEFALAEIEKKFPSLEQITRHRPTDIDIPVGFKFQKLLTKIVLQCDSKECASLHYSTNPEALLSNFEETRISFKELANRYKTDEVLPSLYPMNLLTIEGEVFDITEESNVNYLQSRKEILVSFSKCLSASNVEKLAVSILNLEPKQTDEGVPCATFDVQSNDVTMAMYDLRRALNFVSCKIGKNFILNICTNSNQEKDIMKFIEEELLCCKILYANKFQILTGSFSK
eukprot:Seg4085.2 transcript_id=Seg4085.2/GoldUCD/mRNA.D3Y31 product="Histidine N-acetyltransferase" protein_id=Seg4085.2/GoldUCD/D3Y31